ncbi:hypothetical protein H5410_016958 [Solanum commersonii]|uniref:Uncharacterized protein n=1 Tax=Solanum commersonii TaxID=4109 RepID=A0A9J5ZXR4_SOLCO|nr:hypothetical protein H5410_016958 [Solanum commersonii]
MDYGDYFQTLGRQAAVMAATASGRPPFEVVQPTPPPQTTTYAILFNSNTINPKQSALINSKTIVKSIEIIYGEPTITFSMEERQDFMIKEGLHQAVVFKLSHGVPDLKVLRSILPKHLDTKGNCLIGLLAPRQILLRFNLYEDYVLALSRSVNYLLYDGEEHQYLFAKKPLLSIASAVGKPIAIYKATQIKSRPSTTRVKVILDLMEKLSNRIRLQFVDEKSGQKIMDTSDVEDAENSGQHVLQVENENPTKNWTLVAHKKSTSSQSLSLTSQNNSPCSEKGSTGNFHDSEKRKDTSNASRDLSCLNSFDALLKTTGNQVRLIENDHDLIQEKQVSPPALNSKLSLEAPVFVPKCVFARKNESSALVSNTIDLGEDSLDEDGVDLGEDSLDEDEEDNMLDICFDRVAREGDISPRQQRSGRNKSKKKTYGRQHSWDGKMTEEFVPRHLSMRHAKQNHLTVSIGSTRSNKSIKKNNMLHEACIGRRIVGYIKATFCLWQGPRGTEMAQVKAMIEHAWAMAFA